jgi:hypothetical protein
MYLLFAALVAAADVAIVAVPIIVAGEAVAAAVSATTASSGLFGNISFLGISGNIYMKLCITAKYVKLKIHLSKYLYTHMYM